jgi:hypothetical protein
MPAINSNPVKTGYWIYNKKIIEKKEEKLELLDSAPLLWEMMAKDLTRKFYVQLKEWMGVISKAGFNLPVPEASGSFNIQ